MFPIVILIILIKDFVAKKTILVSPRLIKVLGLLSLLKFYKEAKNWSVIPNIKNKLQNHL